MLKSVVKVKIEKTNNNDEIRRSSQLRTQLKRVVVIGPEKNFQARTGFEPMTSAIPFFSGPITTTRFSSVLSCEDLLISSFHRSANM